MQKIFTAEIVRALAANGRATRERQSRGLDEPDHRPVVKMFNPYGAATWLLTESDPDEPDRLFGLCDLGQGFPELGSVLRSEIAGCALDFFAIDILLEADAARPGVGADELDRP